MSINTNKALIIGAVVIVVGLLIFAIIRGQEAAERATVTVNDQVLTLRVADNYWEWQSGLSGMSAEDVKAHGMLFVFPEAKPQDFWMKGMQLDLDVIWIREGRVVGLERDVLAPKAGEQPVRFTSDPVPVDMVMELPAGSIEHFGLVAGTLLKVELP